MDAKPDPEKIIPRINPTRFTKDISSRELDTPLDDLREMLEFDIKWKIVGWASSADVAPRDLNPYVLLFEGEDGRRIWCHAMKITLMVIAKQIAKDPSRIAQI